MGKLDGPSAAVSVFFFFFFFFFFPIADLRPPPSPLGQTKTDSTTPLVSDLISAGVHLNACFRGSLAHDDAGGRHYEITAEAGARAQPFKRVPGLGLPSTSFFVTREGEDGTLSPLPLHVWDFGLHVFHNWAHAKALTFYVPKVGCGFFLCLGGGDEWR